MALSCFRLISSGVDTESLHWFHVMPFALILRLQREETIHQILQAATSWQHQICNLVVLKVEKEAGSMQRCRPRHSLAFDRGVALHLSFDVPIRDDIKT